MILLLLLACGSPAPKPPAPEVPAAAPAPAATTEAAPAPAAAPLTLVGVVNNSLTRLQITRQGDALSGTLVGVDGAERPLSGSVRGDEWAFQAGDLRVIGRWDGARIVGDAGGASVVFGDGLDPVALMSKVETWTRKDTEVKSASDIPVALPVVWVADPMVNTKIAALLTPGGLFEASRAEIEGDGWADEISFRAPFQKNGLLCLVVDMDGSAAYTDVNSVTRVLDLETGTLVGPETWDPAHTAELIAKLDARLQENVKTAKAEAGPDGPPPEMYDSFTFKDTDLKKFSLGPSGITFQYDFGFPHAVLAAEPDGNLLLTWAEAGAYLTADSPLRRAL